MTTQCSCVIRSCIYVVFFLSSFYVKENDFKYGPKGYFSWPKDIEVHGLWIFGCSLVVHRLASIWSWTSTRLSFGCTKRNQSWSKVYMRSPKNQVSPMEGVCLELVSPIWSTIVQLSQLCFMEQTSLSLSFFLSYIRKKTCSLKCYMISAWRGLCKPSEIP